MRIKLTSLMVDNQDRALKFYTEVFRFEKKVEIPVDEYRWGQVGTRDGLTRVAPDGRWVRPERPLVNAGR